MYIKGNTHLNTINGGFHRWITSFTMCIKCFVLLLGMFKYIYTDGKFFV